MEGSIAGVVVGSVVDSGLLLDRQQDWIKSATAVASCCTVEVNSGGNDGEETLTRGVNIGAVSTVDEEIGTGALVPTVAEASSLTPFIISRNKG